MAELKASGSSGAIQNLAEDEEADERKAHSRPAIAVGLTVSTSRSMLSVPTATENSARSPRAPAAPNMLVRPVRVVAVPDAIEQYQHEAFSEPRHKVRVCELPERRNTAPPKSKLYHHF